MNITNNNTIIYKNEYDGKVYYKAGLSNKKQDGKYEYAYINVKLPKGVELENKTKIDITKGFLSFYNYKDKEEKQHTIWYIVVQEYNKKSEEKKQENSKEIYEQFGNKTEYTADEIDNLPF